MILEKVGDKLTVTVPADVAEALGLHAGDRVTLHRDASGETGEAKAVAVRDAIAAIRSLARPLPPGYRFDREEANAR